jgi:class 3 adenylate cyclase
MNRARNFAASAAPLWPQAAAQHRQAKQRRPAPAKLHRESASPPSRQPAKLPKGNATVTALFADIKGSMELMEDLDPEEARAIVDPALRLMIDAVHRYDGYIVQSTGDGIFALFGAPVAHEDHPLRALYAALRMQEDLKRYSDRLRVEGRVPLQARVGVNTGEVVVRSIQTEDGHAEYTPIGHSTSLAARMQTVAPIGSIAITGNMRNLVEGYFQLKALGPTRVKGVSELLDVVEVTGLGPLRTRLQVSQRRGLTKFVGRQAELEQMKHALELVRQGHGQIVAAMGDPGVGKSRLVLEFKAIAHGGCLVLEAYSVSHSKASAYLPVIDLLKSYFEIANEDDERKRREKVAGKIVMLDRALEDTLPYLFGLLGIMEGDDPLAQLDPLLRRRRTLEAIKRVLMRESINQPLIVIFEDLHWIDSETQALLNLIVDGLATARLLLLVNYRPEYHHQWGNKTYYSQLRARSVGQRERGRDARRAAELWPSSP